MFEEEEYPCRSSRSYRGSWHVEWVAFLKTSTSKKLTSRLSWESTPYIATGLRNVPQYSRDKKQIYLSGTGWIKSHNLETASVSDLTFSQIFTSKGNSFLLKPNLNEPVYVSGYGGKSSISGLITTFQSLKTKKISPHKCKPLLCNWADRKFSDGSKVFYRCGPICREVFLKDLDNTLEVEDILVANTTRMARLTISPDNKNHYMQYEQTLYFLYDITNLPSDFSKIPADHAWFDFHFAFPMTAEFSLHSRIKWYERGRQYKLIQLNYEEIVNNLAENPLNRRSFRLRKPVNFVCSRKSL